jgi:hypothetical protein
VKKDVSPGVTIAIIAIVVVVLAVVAVKYFGIGKDPAETNSTPAEIQEMQAGKAKRMATDIFGRPRTPSPTSVKFGEAHGAPAPTPP